MTETDIRAVLNRIVDPCSAAAGMPAGLDDMGLVREVEVEERAGGAAVRVVLGLTEPACLMGLPFLTSARAALDELSGVGEVHVSLDPVLDWTPAELSPAYAARLEAHRAGRRRTATRGAPHT